MQEVFEGFFTVARYGIFPHLAYISGGSDQMLMKILPQIYPWTRNSPLNFGSNPESRSRVCVRIWTPDPDHILLDGHMRPPTAIVVSEYLFISRAETRACAVLYRKRCLFGSAKKDELHSPRVLCTIPPWALLVNMLVMIAVHQHCHCQNTACSVSSLAFALSF